MQVGLKVSLSDAKVDVRKAALDCSANLLKYMAPKYLKQYEAALVSFLLTGLDDESEDNVKRSMELLEECGSSIHELYGGMEEE